MALVEELVNSIALVLHSAIVAPQAVSAVTPLLTVRLVVNLYSALATLAQILSRQTVVAEPMERLARDLLSETAALRLDTAVPNPITARQAVNQRLELALLALTPFPRTANAVPTAKPARAQVSATAARQAVTVAPKPTIVQQAAK